MSYDVPPELFEDATTFRDNMQNLRGYLESVVNGGLPITFIRSGLKYALAPLGIPVDTTDNPLLYLNPAKGYRGGRKRQGTRRRRR